MTTSSKCSRRAGGWGGLEGGHGTGLGWLGSSVFLTAHLCSQYLSLFPLLPAGRSEFVYDLFEHMALSDSGQGPGGGGIGRRMSLKRKGARKKATVSSQFKDSLHSLMTILGQSNPYFVRCIKPNMMKVSPHLNHLQPSHVCSAADAPPKGQWSSACGCYPLLFVCLSVCRVQTASTRRLC